MILTLLPYIVGGIILSSLLFIPLRVIAFKVKLVDQPNSRKSHEHKTPLIGGIGIAFTVLILLTYSIFEGYSILELKPILLGGAILLCMGVIDDYVDLSAKFKLIIQLFTAHLLYFSGITISSFHGLFGFHEMSTFNEYWLTITIVTGVINAYNLIDGIDGLFAGFTLVTSITISYLAFHFGKYNIMILYLIISGALIGFLRANLRTKQKIFMGDAGSLAIGFVLIGSSLLLLKGTEQTPATSFEATMIFALLCLPVFDSIRVYYERILKSKSPFKADRTHFHHFLISLGCSHRKASLYMNLFLLGVIVSSVIIVFVTNITTAIGFALILYILTTSIIKFFRKLKYWKCRIQRMETKSFPPF